MSIGFFSAEIRHRTPTGLRVAIHTGIGITLPSMPRTKSNGSKDSSATIGFEAKLWLTADKMRNNMDAAEYKHVVLGLIFLKYISDAFNDLHEKLKEAKGEYEGADPEDRDEYLAHNIFFVPEKSRWQFLQDRAVLTTRS
jgi:type I restriction enzyme M protein